LPPEPAGDDVMRYADEPVPATMHSMQPNTVETVLTGGENGLKNDEKGGIVKKPFEPAKTIEEAEKYFNDVLGLSGTGYKTMNLDVANMINKEIQSAYDLFGNVNVGGHLNGINIVTNKKYVAGYSPDTKNILLQKQNVADKSSLEKMTTQAKEQFNSHFWCTDNAEHTIRHELGHAIQHWLTDADATKRGKISALRNKLLDDCGIPKWKLNDTKERKKAAGGLISYYALKTDKELIAESVAEYMTGNPRETAKKVIEILMKGR